MPPVRRDLLVYRGGVVLEIPSTDWRNGSSASDSNLEGYAFESRIGHYHLLVCAADGTPTGTRAPDGVVADPRNSLLPFWTLDKNL